MATCPINMKCILHKLLKSQKVWIVDSHSMLLKSVQQKFRINEADCFFHKNIEDQILMGSIRSPYLSFNFNLLPKIDKWLQGHLFQTLIFCQENTNSPYMLVFWICWQYLQTPVRWRATIFPKKYIYN